MKTTHNSLLITHYSLLITLNLHIFKPLYNKGFSPSQKMCQFHSLGGNLILLTFDLCPYGHAALMTFDFPSWGAHLKTLTEDSGDTESVELPFQGKVNTQTRSGFYYFSPKGLMQTWTIRLPILEAIIALTETTDRTHAFTEGFKLVFIKPVKPMEIAAAITSVTGRLK